MTVEDINYKLVAPRKGKLLANKTFITPIIPVCGVSIPKATLNADGTLNIKAGFVWDFATGAIDTPDMVIASLAHDALCKLVTKGLLPKSAQKDIDVYFRDLLKELGTPFIRRWYSFIAVRLFQSLHGK